VLYAEKIRAILSRPHLQELAVSSGFCRRQSKLSAGVFFDMLFYTVSHRESSSLSFMVSHLKSEFGVKISKQSLDERFHSGCVEFIKAVLSEVLQERFSELYEGELLPAFHRIRIKDSTKFMVPPGLEDHYKGCGGDAQSRSEAGVSIQYEFDLKSGAITDLSLNSGIRNDRKDAGESVENVQAGDLIIRDLGYFSTPVFEKWSEKQVFFLSRVDCSTNVYDANGELICFKDIYEQMLREGIQRKEIFVFIGKETQLGVRMFLQLVPEEVYEKRIREKLRKSKGQGRSQLRDETKIRCRFNLFISNADESMLPVEQFFPLYRLRWQIELNFKVWKSVFNLHNFQRVKEHRYIALLYAKLLLIIINLQITHCLQRILTSRKDGKIRMLSLNKTMKTLSTLFREVFTMFRHSRQRCIQTALYLQSKLSEDHWLEGKKNKLSLPEILYLFICNSEK
jgi:hypothetical protein